MLSKIMISRNYKKKKHDVVIRLNNLQIGKGNRQIGFIIRLIM